MGWRGKIIASVAILSVAISATAGERSASAALAFKRHNPCPSTGQRRGACPGYVIDHIDPLCNGGGDFPSNMQWQSTADAKKKDRWERALCRAKRAPRPL